MKQKGQAAMEFLMTYGWAILAAIIAIGALAYFGVFNSGNLAGGKAAISTPLYLNAWNVQTTGVNLEIRNDAGESINIQSVYVEGCGTNNTAMNVGTGSMQVYNVPCTLVSGELLRGDIRVVYTKAGSNLDLSSTGTIVETIQ